MCAAPPFHFRPNTYDEAIYRMIVEGNEYHLPDAFEPGDVILDIGAHIGSFSHAALLRHAQRIIVVEADAENVALARRHLQAAIQAGRVQLLHGAVWRSDDNDDVLAFGGYPACLSDPAVVNTGGGRAIPGGPGQPVNKIPFDALVQQGAGANHAPIRLLKLDCEGAEFPILFTSTLLHRVQEIVGEFHENPFPLPSSPGADEVPGAAAPVCPTTFDALAQHLAAKGFQVSHVRHYTLNDYGLYSPNPSGVFHAKRPVIM